MTEPAILVLDDVPEELDELQGALRRRYGQEYVVICESSAAAASDHLPGWLRMADRWRSCVLRRR